MKFVNVVEDVIVCGIFSSSAAVDEEKRATLQEFSMSPGPRAVFDTADALTEQEWVLGRLYFLLKTITIFDEFSPSLQLQLYSVEKNPIYGSPVMTIVESLQALDLQEFLPLAAQDYDQEYGDVYTRTLSELCTFALLIQPRQFAKLQVDMIGLALGPTEVLSLLAVDWWTCMSARFGQSFTTSQVLVLMELVSLSPSRGFVSGGLSRRNCGSLLTFSLLYLHSCLHYPLEVRAKKCDFFFAACSLYWTSLLRYDH